MNAFWTKKDVILKIDKIDILSDSPPKTLVFSDQDWRWVPLMSLNKVIEHPGFSSFQIAQSHL